MTVTPPPFPESDPNDTPQMACVLTFNTCDPTGGGGLAADALACASVGAHLLPVNTGAYARDSEAIQEHFALDDEAVTEQARVVLEDMEVQVFKVGFAGGPENLSAIAALASDYAEVPLVAYMPDLSWWRDDQIDLYQDAFSELVLPLTTVLVGNHNTLTRWLLPDWSGERSPSARDLARAANDHGVAYTLVTGMHDADQHISNVLVTPTSVLGTYRFARLEPPFCGAGDTLTAALAAQIAVGTELTEAASEALHYLHRCLECSFAPGMGARLPDRMFWAQPDVPEDEEGPASTFEISPNDTRH